MTVKDKRKICAIVSIIGLIMLYGTVGGIECSTISLGKGTIRMIIYLAMFIGGAYKGGFLR